ncbi:MAG TPA: TFIIB-type zinc ribbon-containing protein [Terriglobales bacterium]|nr:TFIIB-type zinc ribbon-containing protein [Terriglobales bacterium]
MTDVNWADEERRLTEQYAQMDEDELQALANSSYELTEAARHALQSEIFRRGLDFKLRESPAPPSPAFEQADESEDPMDSPLVTVQQVSDLAEARRLQAVLDAKWIPYCWGEDNLENIDALQSSLGDDGIALKVCQSDLGRAVGVLAELSPPEPEEPEEPDYAPVCPKCHSAEIVFQGRDPESATISKTDAKFNWSCDACGNQWKDDGIEEEATAG